VSIVGGFAVGNERGGVVVVMREQSRQVHNVLRVVRVVELGWIP
jgi:hypothetical protein